MADRWNPNNPIDGEYVWLPVKIIDNKIVKLEWHEEWNLNVFN